MYTCHTFSYYPEYFSFDARKTSVNVEISQRNTFYSLNRRIRHACAVTKREKKAKKKKREVDRA